MNIDKSSSRKFVAILFLVVIFFYMLNIFTVLYKNNVFKDISKTVGFIKKVDNVKTRIDKYCTESINFRTKFIEFNSFLKSKFGIKLINDTNGSVIKMNNEYLTYYYSNFNVKNNAKQVVDLKNYLDNENIEFLYVQAPFKINKYNSQLPYDVDYSNIYTDNLLTELEKNNVNIWDIREEFNRQDLNKDNEFVDYYERFYKTDQHWKVETGLEVSFKLIKLLNEKYNFYIDTNLTNTSNYEMIKYKNWFLGSQGKKVSLGFVQPEDFNLILPKFDTNLTLDAPQKNIHTSGKFINSLIDFKRLDKINYYNQNPYAAYLYDDNPICTIRNKITKNEKKILLIKDSFSLVVAPFLALGIQELELIDPRYYKNEVSIELYIKKSKPDLVIIMYNPSTLKNIKAFKFD